MVFCGIDIGTTNTKAVLLDTQGRLVDRNEIPCPKVADSDRSASTWYEHFCAVLEYFKSKGRFTENKVYCSITAQGGSFVLLNDNLQPVSRGYCWTELAADEVVDQFEKSFDKQDFYHVTGWKPDSWLVVSKLKELALGKQMPEDVRFVAAVPDFIFSQMTGKVVTDITTAQITGLCDFEKAVWDSEIVEWTGLGSGLFPPIETELKLLFEDVCGPWGRINLVTSSHDQYGAMEAAGLKKDKGIMLGTGTAWVINIRTSEPVFDDESFLTHPGRDLYADSYGNIIVLGQIGGGFDKLLDKLGVSMAQLGQVEKGFADGDLPKEVIKVDPVNGVMEGEFEADAAIRRYMEWAGSEVNFVLERLGLADGLKQIVMTGGAVSSSFWPQVIADICNMTVEAVDFPEFTAYGAALHCRAAMLPKANQNQLPQCVESRIYEPRRHREYQSWYEQFQRPMFVEYLADKWR